MCNRPKWRVSITPIKIFILCQYWLIFYILKHYNILIYWHTFIDIRTFFCWNIDIKIRCEWHCLSRSLTDSPIKDIVGMQMHIKLFWIHSSRVVHARKYDLLVFTYPLTCKYKHMDEPSQYLPFYLPSWQFWTKPLLYTPI